MDNFPINKSGSTYRLTPQARETMLVLREPLPVKDVAKRLNLKITTAIKRLKRLRVKGLVQQQIKTSITIYELTEKGRQIVGQILSGYNNRQTIIRAHNLRFKSKITRKPKELIEKLKIANWFEVDHKNWIGYKKNIYNCIIEFTPKSVLFHLKQIISNDPVSTHGQAIAIVLQTKAYLEGKYKGLVIGEPEQVATISRQHIASQYDPYSIKAKQNHFSGSTSRVEVDASKDTPELEAIHPIHAVNDMQEILNFYDDIAQKGSPFTAIENILLGERALRTLKVMTKNHFKVIASSTSSKVKQDFYYLLNNLTTDQQQHFIDWFENFVRENRK